MKYLVHEIGCKGQEVARLQEAIGVGADGDFGPVTEQALKDYQSDNNLTIDGRSGPQTRDSLGIQIYPGIDVSRYQGNVDWATVKASGQAEFCWVKISEGNTFLDKNLKKNLKGCRDVGIPVGGYHFARPDLHEDPTKEVQNFVNNCDFQPGDLRPVLDFENADNHTSDSIRAWVVEFLKQAEAGFGVRPIVYTGGNMVKYALRKDTTGIDDYTLWHALYSKKALTKGIPKDRLGGWKEWRVWQWTGSGQVDGISGDVDRNWLTGGQKGFDEILTK